MGTKNMDTERSEFVVGNFKAAASTMFDITPVSLSMVPVNLSIVNGVGSPAMRVVIEQAGIQKQYDVTVSRPSILGYMANVASLGAFSNRAKVKITPVENGRPISDQEKSFGLGVVTSMDSHYTGGREAVTWMLNRPASRGQTLG